jgi:hypothetical protein
MPPAAQSDFPAASPPEVTPTQPTTPAADPATTAQFAPPPKPVKRGRKVFKWLAVALLGALIGGGTYGYFSWQAHRNQPDTIFRDALLHSLQTPKLETVTTIGTDKTTVSYDFSVTTNPVISSQATFQQAGATFGLKGYGNSKNSYFSYTSLPAKIDPKLAASIKDSWVQVRSGGVQPAQTKSVLTHLIDPRGQVVGPVVFGNFDQKTRQQLADFLISHHVYKYDALKVQKTLLGQHKVLSFRATPDIGFLKVANQSAAANLGFTPDDVQTAVDALGELRGSSFEMLIDRGSHQLLEVDIALANGQTETLTYATPANLELPNEPQTKVTWQNFASFQQQLEDQAAGKKAPTTPVTAAKTTPKT